MDVVNHEKIWLLGGLPFYKAKLWKFEFLEVITCL